MNMPPKYPPQLAPKVIDVGALADGLLETVAAEVSKMQTKPKLAVVIAAGNPSSEIYVGRKSAACARVGIASERIDVPAGTSQSGFLDVVRRLNLDDGVDGILVQLPLPQGIDPQAVIGAVDPQKDVDGLHPQNIGKVLWGGGEGGLQPCTPKAVMKILDSIGFDPEGKIVVVVGRSNIVGKPLAAMLMNRQATVVVANSKTPDLASLTLKADAIIVAAGKPGLLTGDMVKKGAVVIDVGINRLEDGKVVGDVDFYSVAPKASRITPVPGGVGPMTVAALLENTLWACKSRRRT